MEHISEHLVPATELEKRELAKLEQKPSVTGDEKKFVKALKNPQVVQRPLEELKEVLRLMFMKVGIRAANIPDKVETAVLIDHIVNNYGSKTHEEIKLAFDLALTGKLDDDPNFANCFESFSCAYISKIMNAYRDWTLKTYKSVIKKEEKMIAPIPEIKVIPDEDMEKDWDVIENLVRNNGYKLELINEQLYDWMDKNGNILVEKEQKMEYIERATLYRHSVIAKGYEKNPHSIEAKQSLVNFNEMRSSKNYSPDEHEKIKLLAKKMVVFDMMKAKTSKIKI